MRLRLGRLLGGQMHGELGLVGADDELAQLDEQQRAGLGQRLDPRRARAAECRYTGLFGSRAAARSYASPTGLASPSRSRACENFLPRAVSGLAGESGKQPGTSRVAARLALRTAGRFCYTRARDQGGNRRGPCLEAQCPGGVRRVPFHRRRPAGGFLSSRLSQTTTPKAEQPP